MSLKRLSEQLELSQTTVSRALNGYPEVSNKTRDRVMLAAKAMNYRPNSSARSLATGRSWHIGTIFPVERELLTTPLFNEFINGVTQYLVESNMDITIIPTTKADELATYRRVAQSGQVDGLLVSTPTTNDPRIDILKALNFPFVVHGRTESTSDYPYIDIDNEGAFFRATNLLLDLGHERIALINGEIDQTFAAHRFKGYQSAHALRNISINPEWVYHGSMKEEHGYRETKRCLALDNPPSAFIVSSVILALGTKRAIREKGLEPGDDISIIAHDDDLPYLAASQFSPALTTTTSSLWTAGYTVAKQLSHIIDHGFDNMPQQVLDVDLIVRESTKAYRHRV